VAELQWRFDEAVRIRLMSDVPLGAFLSGGIDSSAVVAYMAQNSGRPVQTFSVGFEDDAFDERPFARIVAQQYATDHTELIVKAPVRDILPRLAWQYDEPLGDPSTVPSYAIAELTRGYVTVVLNGDGGDESFAGYNRYGINRLFGPADAVPLALRRTLSAAVGFLPAAAPPREPVRKIKKLFELLALERGRRYARWFGHFTPEERGDLYTADFRASINGSEPETLFVEAMARGTSDNGLDAALETDVNYYLPDDLLVKMDRASMAHSLEARSPFLDHIFMEFAASLPPGMKFAGREKKRILKAALRDKLPSAILDRPKMGFGAPISRWFRNELREMTHDILLSKRAAERGYFNGARVANLLEAHCAGKRDHAEILWDLLVLELWQRTFFDAPPPPSDVSYASFEQPA
jgi:asparagine synthase (glutamine-hydrolysing)